MNEQFCEELCEVLRGSETYRQRVFVNGCATVEIGGVDCGTPGCIAGHAVALSRRRAHRGRMAVPMSMAARDENVVLPKDMPIFREAQQAMGLGDDQAEALFHPMPYEAFKPRRSGGGDGEANAQEREEQRREPTGAEAASVVWTMLETGGEVDWREPWDAAYRPPAGGAEGAPGSGG